MAENSMYHTHISAKHRWMDLNLKEVRQLAKYAQAALLHR